MWQNLGSRHLLTIKKSNLSWTNVILSCKPSDFKWQVHSQKWDSGSQWYILLKEILCGLSRYQKLNFENLALAPGFAGECHIYEHVQIDMSGYAGHLCSTLILDMIYQCCCVVVVDDGVCVIRWWVRWWVLSSSNSCTGALCPSGASLVVIAEILYNNKQTIIEIIIQTIIETITEIIIEFKKWLLK